VPAYVLNIFETHNRAACIVFVVVPGRRGNRMSVFLWCEVEIVRGAEQPVHPRNGPVVMRSTYDSIVGTAVDTDEPEGDAYAVPDIFRC
jgi:hypothetical protein